ncbi:uncharacterized protein METZ01_LOCUS400524 [marine metagenome]|uniref:Uncharacterized protein n=1 Tax=marine metagenome TaxID=408172 RepID=A0A382VMR8_9ZZZZ
MNIIYFVFYICTMMVGFEDDQS